MLGRFERLRQPIYVDLGRVGNLLMGLFCIPFVIILEKTGYYKEGEVDRHKKVKVVDEKQEG